MSSGPGPSQHPVRFHRDYLVLVQVRIEIRIGIAGSCLRKHVLNDYHCNQFLLRKELQKMLLCYRALVFELYHEEGIVVWLIVVRMVVYLVVCLLFLRYLEVFLSLALMV